MIRAHVAAIHALLTTAGVTLYGAGVGTTDDGDTGEVPGNPAYPYGLLGFPGPIAGSESLGDLRERQEFDFTISVFGDSSASVWAESDLVHGALDGVEPVVAGRLCRVEGIFANPAAQDTDVADRTVWFAQLGFTLTSRAA